MKKFTFLVAALCATMMASAAVTFTGNAIGEAGTEGSGSLVEKTIDGVTLSIDKGYVKIDPKVDVNWIRAYSGAKMTISATSNISKIVITTTKPESSTKDKYSAAAFSASSYSVSSDKTVGTWTGSATSVTFSASAQVRMISVEVTLGEGGEGEGGEESGDYTYTFKYAEANNYYDYLADDTEDITIYLFDDPKSDTYTQLDLLVATGTGLGDVMPTGVYNINDGLTVGSAYIGDVDDEYSPIGCWAFGDGEEDYWDMASGTVTITKEGSEYKIVVAALATDGTKIDVTYQGALNIVEGKFADGINTVEIDNTVYARDGRIYAEEGARIYSLTGLDVTRMNGNLEGIYIVKNGNKVAKVAVAK